jgi:hypothetical protein
MPLVVAHRTDGVAVSRAQQNDKRLKRTEQPTLRPHVNRYAPKRKKQRRKTH